ncbi:MAG TPA: DUF6690 family protein [Planctomycetaceae bacterium]|jgi:hypothetical protein
MRFLPALVVFGAAGAGYVYSHGNLTNISPATWISDEGSTPEKLPADIERLAAAPKEEVIAVAGPEVSNFGDVFRFDMTPQAVTQRWSRVSTGLGDARLQGYRVPLVTGNDDSDLAGSLTYYFDGNLKLRRITFLGTTGNPRRLVDFLGKQYGFRHIQTGHARAMTYQVRYRFTGRLKVTPNEILDKHLASTNYQVELSLER